MGAGYSCGGTDYDAVDQSIEALIKTISCDGNGTAEIIRSLTFNGHDAAERSLLKAFKNSSKTAFDGPQQGRKGSNAPDGAAALEDPKSSVTSPRVQRIDTLRRTCRMPSRFKDAAVAAAAAARWFGNAVPGEQKPEHDAAVRLQKVYRSFRTRRKLADCAVLVEQRWWKLLEFALLKRSSVSFFEIERPESVISRWSRARTRAAKVGKGLSKDGKAQKLALQHWLEAIDPRHRYGHNLHFYYDMWLKCESRQPFFYWLDVGEGKEVSHDRCPRSKLQQQCIKYLGPKEREKYEVVVQDGKFVFKETGEILDTSVGPKNTKWIFVLSTTKKLYVGQKSKGTFQHSSFLAGGATSAAGRLVVENGILKAVWPHSGHYRPTEQNFQEFVGFLEENDVDLTDVKRSPDDDDEESWSNVPSSYPSRLGSTNDMAFLQNVGSDMASRIEETDASDDQIAADNSREIVDRVQTPKSRTPQDKPEQDANNHSVETTAFDRLYALCIQQLFKEFEGDTDDDDEVEEEEESASSTQESKSDDASPQECAASFSDETQREGDRVASASEEPSTSDSEKRYKRNLFEEGQDEIEEPAVPRELIQRRIDLKKGTRSYQLGKQLSCRWTTGAGPRIGCVRDYPSELQFRALEDMDLSPRSSGQSRLGSSPRTFLSSSTQSPRTSSPLK